MLQESEPVLKRKALPESRRLCGENNGSAGSGRNVFFQLGIDRIGGGVESGCKRGAFCGGGCCPERVNESLIRSDYADNITDGQRSAECCGPNVGCTLGVPIPISCDYESKLREIIFHGIIRHFPIGDIGGPTGERSYEFLTPYGAARVERTSFSMKSKSPPYLGV